MSEKWTPTFLEVEDINGGNKYDEGMITVEDYNKVIEGVQKANLDSRIAEEHSAEALVKATSAEENSNDAVQTAMQANKTAQTAQENSNTAIATSNEAKETATNAVEVSDDALEKITGLTAESIQDGGLMYAEVVTNADGSIKLVLYNIKGDKGDGAIPIYKTLGNNEDGAITQKLVTEELAQKLEADDVLPLVESKADKTYVDESLLTKADSEDIPTNVSDLANDAGYDTETSVNQKIANAGGTIIASTEPAGKANAIWINPTTGIIKYWDGEAWEDTYGVFS